MPRLTARLVLYHHKIQNWPTEPYWYKTWDIYKTSDYEISTVARGCRNYYSQRHANSNNFSYQEKIVTKAYDAFNECVRFITLVRRQYLTQPDQR